MALIRLGGGMPATAFCRAELHSRRGSWPCAEEAGAGVSLHVEHRKMWAGWENGWDEVGFVLSLLMTGGAFAFS